MMRWMNTHYAMLPVLVLVALLTSSAAWAADAQASLSAAQSDEMRPATLGDIRYLEERMDSKVSSLEERMDSKISSLEERMDSKISSLEQRMDGRISSLEQRMDGRISRLEERMDSRLSSLEARMDSLEERMTNMFLALLMVMIALFGLPHIPDWWPRLRAQGTVAASSGIALAVLVPLIAGAIIAGGF